MTRSFNDSMTHLTARIALCAAALGVTSGAQAGNADAVLTMTAIPTVASVSRDATAEVPQAADFKAAYTVSIYNPSNSSKNFRFIGSITVDADDNNQSTPPTQFRSSRSDCKLSSTIADQIVCPKLEVAKGATINIRFEFRTPTAGKRLNLEGNLIFPASNGTLTAQRTASTELVKLNFADYTLGFNTYVPATGGTFFSGAPSTLPNSPGGVATGADPFTTTVVIPPITFITTATVSESQKGEETSCRAFAVISNGCFESNITIPSDPGRLAGMQIYLRIDASRRDPTASLNSVQIGYAKDPGSVPTAIPSCQVQAASPGKPCIRARKQYGNTADIPLDWQFDWEFLIEAVDNGRYVNL